MSTIEVKTDLSAASPEATCDFKLEVVTLPVSPPPSVAFGGPELRTLFVTTATLGFSAAQLSEQPLAGAVLTVDVGVPGAPVAAFAGDLV